MSHEKLRTNKYYSTSQMSLACAISLLFPIEAIDRSNPSKVEFLFKREEGLDDVIESFWKREFKVDALGYFNQLKVLKSRIYETR